MSKKAKEKNEINAIGDHECIFRIGFSPKFVKKIKSELEKPPFEGYDDAAWEDITMACFIKLCNAYSECNLQKVGRNRFSVSISKFHEAFEWVKEQINNKNVLCFSSYYSINRNQ